MLERLRQWLPGNVPAATASSDGVVQTRPPSTLDVAGFKPFDVAASMTLVNGLPVPDWQAAGSWVTSVQDPSAQAQAWAKVELAWLAHLQSALGAQYHLAQHDQALVLSSLEPRVAAATVQFMTKTLSRIEKVLEGVAQVPPWGQDILLVFEDEDTYYRYASRYYPDDGEFAFSGGMHIDYGCSHYITIAAELRAIEPVIAHEMTHGCLAHLPIPAWLNEGVAVNTERRLCPPLAQQHTPTQLDWMHKRFWTPQTIQEFWSGKSFLRPDEGNMLSYELARILVEQCSRDWAVFKGFINQAHMDDAGQSAAKLALDVDLGRTVCALFEFEHTDLWAPNPKLWDSKPERGAF